MSESILDVVSEYATEGSFVQLTLLSKEKISGVVKSITGSVIVIGQENGNIRIIKSENLFDFEIVTDRNLDSQKGFHKESKEVEKEGTEAAEVRTQNNEVKVENESKENEKGREDVITETVFRRDFHLQEITPDFKIENLSIEERQELNRIKSKYEYALKIQELNRIRQLIPEVEEIAANIGHHKVYLIAGLLSRMMKEVGKAEKYFQLSLSLQNKQAGIMLAILSSETDDWPSATSYLLYSLLSEKGNDVPIEDVLLSLGSCLYRSENKEVKGLGQIQSELKTEYESKIFYSLVSLALSAKFPEASQKALDGKILEASKLAADSPIFYPIPAFKAEHKVEQTIRKKELSSKSDIIYGHISAYYSDKFYGFIVSISNITYYFHHRDIENVNLKNILYKGTTGQKIEFLSIPRATGHKYSQAIQINTTEPPSSVDDKSNLRGRSVGPLPYKDSTYSFAKIAEGQKEFDNAKKLYKQVIDSNGEYSNSAIKDLASLLNRQDHPKEAIDILNKYKKRFADLEPLNKMKVLFFIKAGEYTEASSLLKLIIRKSVEKQDKLNWLRQLAYCQMMDGNVDEALKLVNDAKRKYPKDQLLRDLIEKMENIKLTGNNGEIEELQSLAGISSGLSSFSRHLIKNCGFAGADERAKARGFFSQRDFREIGNLFDRIDGRRPKEKANLLITTAAMTDKSPEAAGRRNTIELLGRAFAFMGEAATYEGVNKDTIRFYLTEAMNLMPKVDLRFPLAFFLSTYLPARPAPGELLSKRVYNIEKLLQKFEKEKEVSKAFLRDVSYYDIHVSVAIDLLLVISKKNNLTLLDAIIPNRSKSMLYVKKLIQDEQRLIQTLIKQKFRTKSIFEETAKNLIASANDTLFELDRQRVIDLANISFDCGRYLEENDYVEKESKFNRLKTAFDEFIEDVYQNPTKLTFEHLNSLAEKMKRSIMTNFEKYQSNTKPQLELSNILSDDYYIPDKNGMITLHLGLISKPGGAPVEGVEILVREEEGLKPGEPTYSPEILKGGQNREFILQIQPSSDQISQQAFSIRCYIFYKNRSGEIQNSADFSFPIRLGTYADFRPIGNPYQNYSGGKSVEDPNMFKGREDVIKRMIQVVGEGPVGQCFVLYGQKRSGKTSILNQLKLRLPEKNCIPISLSLGELDIDYGAKKTNFIALCIEKLCDFLEDNFDYSPEDFPSDVEIKSEPNSAFRKSLRKTAQIIKNFRNRNPRIVFLIDEFTYVYEYIVEGSVSPDFMRNWKALLQTQLFSAVVVGQDSMPLFKQAYPNEFGVTHDERISYLSRRETARLSSDPILLESLPRYRGRAQERLFELTAGSPFYTHIVCDRLVNFLNFRHAPFITEADIDSVLFGWRGGDDEFSGLIVGSESLPLERFDPLITAAGESVAQNTRETYLGILVSIAKSSGKKALLSDLPQVDNFSAILKDMNEREIISVDAAKRYSIRVGLFAEWLSINKIFSGLEGGMRDD